MSSSAWLRRSPATLVVAVLVALALWWFTADEPPSESDPASAGSDRTPGQVATLGPVDDGDERGDVDEDGLETVRLADLPPQAAEVVAQIEAGGPFDHPGKDGARFGNFEGRLPAAPRGHYREYTVPTPGLSHRGARRIVTGGGSDLYWTPDHYETFFRIRR